MRVDDKIRGQSTRGSDGEQSSEFEQEQRKQEVGKVRIRTAVSTISPYSANTQKFLVAISLLKRGEKKNQPMITY
jgi:hypothetical protein